MLIIHRYNIYVYVAQVLNKGDGKAGRERQEAETFPHRGQSFSPNRLLQVASRMIIMMIHHDNFK